MIRYGWEKLDVILAEPNIRELVEGYWEELSPIKSIARCDPDWDELLRREAAGVLFTWTARVDRTLAGFIMLQVSGHILCKSTLFALDCGHYLAPAFRDNSRIGFRMWRTAEIAARAKGAKVMLAHDNALRPLMPFFLALGFEARSTMFWKVLA